MRYICTEILTKASKIIDTCDWDTLIYIYNIPVYTLQHVNCGPCRETRPTSLFYILVFIGFIAVGSAACMRRIVALR